MKREGVFFLQRGFQQKLHKRLYYSRLVVFIILEVDFRRGKEKVKINA
jgi:hypothetical protein